MVTLTLIRGLPGSGKTTFARAICAPDQRILSADDHFMRDGKYVFDPNKLSAAHAQCLRRTRAALVQNTCVIVCNTFSMRWELESYLSLATFERARLFVVDLFDGGLTDDQLVQRCVHGVPLRTIERMRQRWEHDWRNASPTRPDWRLANDPT